MTPRQARIGVDLFTAAVIASVAIALAGLTWRLAGNSDDAGRRVTASAAPPPPAIDVGPLLALAPFGKTAAAAAPSTLSLELRGILLAAPRSASSVLIGTAGGPSRAWMLGQAIDGGAVVQDIAIDHVVLSVNGQLQTLAFPRPGATAGTSPAISPAATATATALGFSAAPPAAALPPAAAGGTSTQALLDSMGATPTSRGYRIGQNVSGAMRQAGLQPGDVIEKVNGTVVGDVERDRSLLDAAAKAGVARVEVVRNGTRVTLAFPLR